MASSSSRSHVTITLGRSGQVVKRRAIADIGNHNGVPFSGKKRSMRERLGSNMDSEFLESQQRNKRRQTESSSLHGGDVFQVGKDDLRLKLMRKGLLPRNTGGVKQNEGGLREKLSRSRKNLPRYDPRGHAPESRDGYNIRDKVPELGPRYSLMEGVPWSKPSAVVACRVPSARSVDDLMQLDSSINPYSSWVFDGLRHRSPEMPTRVWRASPPRAYEQIQPMPSHRPVGSSIAPSHTARVSPEKLRSQQYVSKSTVSVDRVKRANGLTASSPAPATAPVMTEAPLTVTGLLNSLGLEKYSILFQAEEVDMAALSQMGDNDLKDMGVPMGPRKKILLALGPNLKKQQR